MPKLVIAAVNGFAVDGGNVLQVVAGELRGRGPFALAALKTAFSGRHTGVAGQARIAHDLLLTAYRSTEESKEMSLSFEERQAPDRAGSTNERAGGTRLRLEGASGVSGRRPRE